jgi:TolB protein
VDRVTKLAAAVLSALMPLALIAGACSSDSEPGPSAGWRPGPVTDSPDGDPLVTEPPEPPALDSAERGPLSDSTSQLPGQLAVLGVDESIKVMDPDGSDVVVLAPPAAGSSIEERTQPTWSPDGERVAWTETTTTGEVELVTSMRSGFGLTRIEFPFMAAYIAWSPDGERLAVMGNDLEGGLRTALTRSGGPVRHVESGAPAYFDWSPDSSGLLLHIDDRLEFAPVDGSERISVETDGDFRVGAFLGSRLLYAVDAGIGEALVIGDDMASVPTGIMRFAAPAAYVVHPDEDRIAILARGSRESAAVVELDDPLLAVLEPSRLEILDLRSKGLETVTEEPAIAWFWSPDGTRLLYSTAVVEDGDTKVKWWVYENGEVEGFPAFVPTGEFGRGYLAYFDQFDRTTSFWSPDSNAFAYAGGRVTMDTDETPTGDGSVPEGDVSGAGEVGGIWVQIVGDRPPMRIADGQVAVWSPAQPSA